MEEGQKLRDTGLKAVGEVPWGSHFCIFYETKQDLLELQRIAEGETTKKIAALLGISVKTVEAHRLQLMRRLKIDNIPGLVRFAIRTGLVSPED